MSMGSKSSMSPTESRVYSEQSENTLDSDSKLSNSVQFKLLQSPQNSFIQQKSNNSCHQGEMKSTDDDREADDKNDQVLVQSEKNPSTETARREKGRSSDIFAEQDMFSEHFDVSLLFYYYFYLITSRLQTNVHSVMLDSCMVYLNGWPSKLVMPFKPLLN
jgi:hypothetical protein